MASGRASAAICSASASAKRTARKPTASMNGSRSAAIAGGRTALTTAIPAAARKAPPGSSSPTPGTSPAATQNEAGRDEPPDHQPQRPESRLHRLPARRVAVVLRPRRALAHRSTLSAARVHASGPARGAHHCGGLSRGPDSSACARAWAACCDLGGAVLRPVTRVANDASPRRGGRRARVAARRRDRGAGGGRALAGPARRDRAGRRPLRRARAPDGSSARRGGAGPRRPKRRSKPRDGPARGAGARERGAVASWWTRSPAARR